MQDDFFTWQAKQQRRDCERTDVNPILRDPWKHDSRESRATGTLRERLAKLFGRSR